MKTELLIQLDGLLKSKKRVFLLAASNLPWDLDIAMLRRLEKRVYNLYIIYRFIYHYLIQNQEKLWLEDMYHKKWVII